MQVEAPENLDEELKEFTGLGSTRPKFAAALAILLFSAMGLPGTAGFLGKFFVLRPLISGGAITVAVLAILITVIASAYYLKLIMLMYMRQRDPDESYRLWRKGPADLIIFVCAALSLLLGLWPALGGLIPLP
jgi:NADH-quinone oxidoreductase subunit N